MESDACRVGMGGMTGTWGFRVHTEVYKPREQKERQEHADGPETKELKCSSSGTVEERGQ